jgi:hypothetical protein
VAGTHRRHRLIDLLMAAGLVDRLVGLLIVAKALPMVLSAVVAAAVAVVGFAVEQVEALVTVVAVEEPAVEWAAVAAVLVAGEVYCCSSSIDQRC